MEQSPDLKNKILISKTYTYVEKGDKTSRRLVFFRCKSLIILQFQFPNILKYHTFIKQTHIYNNIIRLRNNHFWNYKFDRTQTNITYIKAMYNKQYNSETISTYMKST